MTLNSKNTTNHNLGFQSTSGLCAVLSSQINYIPCPDGLAAIYVKKNSEDGKYFYVHKDHLGSILSLTGQDGEIIDDSEQSFDPWGKHRSPDLWTALSSPPSQGGVGGGLPWFNRGFTGHEHLPKFDLINMNARLYDPELGRFLAVDNFVQGATNTQGYNRYSYCLNNPMKYTDPDGEWVNFIIGAILGGISGYQIAKAEGKHGLEVFPYLWIGSSIGFATAGIGAYVGGAVAASTGSLLAANVAGGAIAGGVSSAGFAALSGKDIGMGAATGFLAGGIGAFAGGSIGGGAGAFVGGAVAGGLGTAMNGGSLEQIGLSALIGGGVSYAGYMANMGYWYYNYNKNPTMGYLKFSGYAKISTAIQRSNVRGVEVGGNILANGKVMDIVYGEEGKVTIPGNLQAIADFHTHPGNTPGPSWTDIDCQTNEQYVVTSKNIYPVCMEDRLNILNQ